MAACKSQIRLHNPVSHSLHKVLRWCFGSKGLQKHITCDGYSQHRLHRTPGGRPEEIPGSAHDDSGVHIPLVEWRAFDKRACRMGTWMHA